MCEVILLFCASVGDGQFHFLISFFITGCSCPRTSTIDKQDIVDGREFIYYIRENTEMSTISVETLISIE